MKAFVVAAVLAAGAVAASAQAAAPPQPVFVVMGQSNAVLGAAAYTQAIRRNLGPHPVVVCAVSGTPLREFESTGPIYQRCLRRLDALGARRRVAGVFFFQGESDTLDERSAVSWRPRFKRLVVDWRRDTTAGVPFVVAQIGHGDAGGSYWRVVQQAQTRIPLKGVATIRTSDLEGCCPAIGMHFTPASYRTIGERFVRAYLALAR